MTWKFQEVSRRAERSGVCPGCGGATRRRQTFTHTVNPFNKNADGTVKTPQEVGVDVQRLADEWVPDFWHESCKAVS